MNNEFKSRQVYPSINGSVYVIEFFLPEEAIVSLSIVSEHGVNIEQVIDKVRFEAGRHEVEFDHKKINGDYCFYRLSMQTDLQEIVDTKKIFMKSENV